MKNIFLPCIVLVGILFFAYAKSTTDSIEDDIEQVTQSVIYDTPVIETTTELPDIKFAEEAAKSLHDLHTDNNGLQNRVTALETEFTYLKDTVQLIDTEVKDTVAQVEQVVEQVETLNTDVIDVKEITKQIDTDVKQALQQLVNEVHAVAKSNTPVKVEPVTINTLPQPTQDCPNGACPAPTTTRQTYRVYRPLFGR
jgi:methyl-accepting chemotaxis protein